MVKLLKVLRILSFKRI